MKTEMVDYKKISSQKDFRFLVLSITMHHVHLSGRYSRLYKKVSLPLGDRWLAGDQIFFRSTRSDVLEYNFFLKNTPNVLYGLIWTLVYNKYFLYTGISFVLGSYLSKIKWETSFSSEDQTVDLVIQLFSDYYCYYES